MLTGLDGVHDIHANAKIFIVTMLAFSLKQHCVYVQPCRPVSIT